MSKIAILAVAVALVVGLVIGFFVGRALLERSWRQPQMMLTPGEHDRLAANDADPVPPSGAKVLRSMPLQRTRTAVTEFVASDPLRVTVGAVGNGDDGAELHIDVINTGKCTVTDLAGVAYG